MIRICQLVAFILILGAPTAAQESKVAPVVKDEAKLFKAETIKHAEAVARDLGKHGVRLVIETYPALPPSMSDKVKEMSAKDREAAFDAWSKQQLKTLGPALFQIVLTNDPKHLQVTIGADVIRKGFTPADRQALTRAMLEQLNKGQIDEALEGALVTLRKRFGAPPEKSGKSLNKVGNQAR